MTFDPRGNGRSDRPATADAYGPRVMARDALAVLDAAGVAHCVIGVHCGSAGAGILLAADHPDRIRGALFFAPALPLSPPLPERTGHSFDAELEVYEGWARTNRHSWAQDFRGYLEFFFDRCYSEPHSTKQIEDCIDWALETDGETLAHTIDAPAAHRGRARRARGHRPLPARAPPGADQPPDARLHGARV